MSRFVLVHGAWSGTAARPPVAHSLTAAGHQGRSAGPAAFPQSSGAVPGR